jgi:hypothetical protein
MVQESLNIVSEIKAKNTYKPMVALSCSHSAHEDIH